MKKAVEICCGSYYDAIQAYKAGADRIELNTALFLGGLTPSIGSLMKIKEETELSVISMVRSRAGGFCYLEEDYQLMKRDAKELLANGSDGLAFGFLKEDFEPDATRIAEFIELIKSFGKEAVVHRAFDCTKDPRRSIEMLIKLGADRILTSGQAPNAVKGIGLLKELQSEYGRDIELLAGCGVNESNAADIMRETGIMQLHSSCKEWLSDETTVGQDVSYAYVSGEFEKCYETVSYEKVCELVRTVKEFYP